MSDSIFTTQKDLIDALLANLPTGFTAEQVKLPNAPFDTPKNLPWLRVTNNLLEKENVAAGGIYARQFGIFTVDVFYPRETGDLAALETLEHIITLYQNKHIGNAACEAVSPIINEAGENWFNCQADVSYYYEGAALR